MDEEFYLEHVKNLGWPELGIERALGSVDDKKLNTLTRVMITIQIGNELVDVAFQVIEDIIAQLILGNNALRLGIQDGPKQMFTLGESEAPIRSYQQK